MPEKIATERRTRGDRWRTQMALALAAAKVGNTGRAYRSQVERVADAGIALADDEARADRVKLRDLRILLERQRDDATALMRRALSEGVQHHRATALRNAALEGLRILEREP